MFFKYIDINCHFLKIYIKCYNKVSATIVYSFYIEICIMAVKLDLAVTLKRYSTYGVSNSNNPPIS